MSYHWLLLLGLVAPAFCQWEANCGSTLPEAARAQLAKKKIIGGTAATDLRQFPWMAAVESSLRRCNGVILNLNSVISTASCVDGLSETQVFVRVGSLTYDGGFTYNVAETNSHSQYNADTNENDIAIVVLAAYLDRDINNINPVCRPNADLTYDGDLATVSGWGATEPVGFPNNELLYVDIPVIGGGTCGLYGAAYNPNTMLCSGSTGKGICFYDTGSPLVTLSDELIGIASWHNDCGLDDYPGVFTRVTTYLGWIDENDGGGIPGRT